VPIICAVIGFAALAALLTQRELRVPVVTVK
jgi:hypothetical protein